VPIYNLFGNSWENALGIWGIGTIVVGIVWIFAAKENIAGTGSEGNEHIKLEKNIYLNLLKMPDIRHLCYAFMCDMFCYSYIAVILPTFLAESGHMTEAIAGFWSAVAFPGFGLLGCMTGGIVISMTGLRRPTMAAGQVFKFLGVLIATVGSIYSVWFIVIGIAFFGIGNSIWMPPMYMVPMELEGMNSMKVGAAFSIINSCGFAAAFFSPIIGGWLTNLLMNTANISDPVLKHVFGMRWSLFAAGFLSVVSFLCVLKVRETGKASQKLEVSLD
jgi:hypothetical protein